MAITVQRNNIVVGAITGFEIGKAGLRANRGIGATTGECTLRREVEFFDVDVEQAFGTIRKSPVSDKRFLSVSTAEMSLQRLLEAWNDDQSVSAGVVDADFDQVSAEKANPTANFYTADTTDVGETAPAGLAHDGTRFLMIGNTTDKLYQVNNLGQTRSLTEVGVANFDLASAPANAILGGLTVFGTTVYSVARGSSGNGILVEINPTNGRAAKAGTGTDLGTGSAGGVLGGLTNDNTNLYAILEGASNAWGLYNVNRATGVAAAVGSATRFGVGTSATAAQFEAGGLAYGNDKLYALLKPNTASGWSLYEVAKDGTTPAPGIATKVGTLTNLGLPDGHGGTDPTADAAPVPTGLTFFDGQLWAADSAYGGLIRIDPATGQARPVGDTSSMFMNNMPTGGNIDNLEKRVKIIVPGASNTFRVYIFYNCVSVAPAEHSYQKNGLTMVPYEFEVLVDPNRRDGQYGVIKDFPTVARAEAFVGV